MRYVCFWSVGEIRGYRRVEVAIDLVLVEAIEELDTYRYTCSWYSFYYFVLKQFLCFLKT